jgi:hypothetical protein
MAEKVGRKKPINVPLDWALNQILYSFDEGISKSDVVAAAIRNCKEKASAGFISKKLQKEYSHMDPKDMSAPELTSGGRRALLHINIPVELYDKAQRYSEASAMSFNKTISFMLHKLYDSGATVTPVPRATRAGAFDTVRVAINFPIQMIEEANKLSGIRDFRATVLTALEDYIRRNSDGRGSNTEGMGS